MSACVAGQHSEPPQPKIPGSKTSPLPLDLAERLQEWVSRNTTGHLIDEELELAREEQEELLASLRAVCPELNGGE